MKFLSCITLSAIALTTTFSLAYAKNDDFARFTLVTPGTTQFRFNNDGTNASSFFTIAPVAVKFRYVIDNGTGLVDFDIDALLNVTSVVGAPATYGVLTATQKLQNVQMTFTGTGLGGGPTGNLLTLSGSTGDLGGVLGFSDAGIAETDNGLGNPDHTITYSSAYLDFVNSTQRYYNISLNNLTPPLANGGTYIGSFNSDATGLFGSNGLVPEPSTVALLVLGSFGLIVQRRKKSHC